MKQPPSTRQALAEKLAVPARVDFIGNVSAAMTYLLQVSMDQLQWWFMLVQISTCSILSALFIYNNNNFKRNK